MRHLCDVNVFLAATIDAHPHHPAARAWFDRLEGNDTAEFCRITQNSFLRLLTTRVTENYVPASNNEAVSVYRTLRSDSAIGFSDEPPRMEENWLKWAASEKSGPKVWTDAYLAAFAHSARMRFVTFDAGFEQYRREGLDLLLLTASMIDG